MVAEHAVYPDVAVIVLVVTKTIVMVIYAKIVLDAVKVKMTEPVA